MNNNNLSNTDVNRSTSPKKSNINNTFCLPNIKIITDMKSVSPTT